MTHSRRAFLHQSAIGTIGASVLLSGAKAVYGRKHMLPSSESTAFFDAARKGDVAKIQQLLSKHPALLEAKNEQGASAFTIARLHHHTNISDFLVSKGYATDLHEAALALDWERFKTLAQNNLAAVHQNHPIGGSAMFAAATGGAGSDIWRVYAQDGDPSVVPDGASGGAPLQAALRVPNLATAEMTAATLLGNNANPNPSTKAWESPLHIAARRGSTAMVEMLIRKGAHVEARNADGHTAAELAQRGSHKEVAALLLNHQSIPRTHNSSGTAWDVNGAPYRPQDIRDIPMAQRSRFVGVSHGNLDAVTQGVTQDPRMVHSVATTGERCIEACAHTGQKPVVDFLLEHGAPYSLPTAVVRNDYPRVKALLEEDPLRIHERGAHDFALLWYPLIGGGGVEMLEVLLDRGAIVEQQHYLGTTALHWACFGTDLDVVRLLIENGADINRRGRKFDAAGQTPLECAEKRKRTETVKLLKQLGATA